MYLASRAYSPQFNRQSVLCCIVEGNPNLEKKKNPQNETRKSLSDARLSQMHACSALLARFRSLVIHLISQPLSPIVHLRPRHKLNA